MKLTIYHHMDLFNILEEILPEENLPYLQQCRDFTYEMTCDVDLSGDEILIDSMRSDDLCDALNTIQAHAFVDDPLVLIDAAKAIFQSSIDYSKTEDAANSAWWAASATV